MKGSYLLRRYLFFWLVVSSFSCVAHLMMLFETLSELQYLVLNVCFSFAVTLLDSRSVQGELGWIASPLEGGVSSEYFI